MARSPEEIRKSMQTSIQNKDRTIDITTGPVNDIVLTPVPNELSVSENEALRLSRLHSTWFAQVAKPEEVDALRTSMRLPAGTGEKSKGLQLFWSNQIPDSGVVIPKGTIVSTRDGKYSYTTTEERVVDGTNKEAFYNSDTYRYEILLPIEAITAGPEYDIPIGRINNLVSDIDGIDGTSNYSSTVGGSANESQTETVKRIQQKFVGFDRGTGNGLDVTYIRNAYPTLIVDVALIRPKDPLFKRPTRRTALDVYISGQDPQPHTMTYVITEADEQILVNGQVLKLVLNAQPVISVEKVDIEGIPGEEASVSLQVGTGVFQYLFVKDKTVFFDSSRAQDQVWIQGGTADPTKLRAGQKITVNFTADDLIINLQSKQFNPNTTIFETDVLCRKGLEAEIVIEMLAKLLTDPSDERSQAIKAELESLTIAYIENGRFGRTLNPEVVRQELKALAPNVIDIYFRTFRRKSGAFRQIETVELNRNEIPKVYEEDGVPFMISMVK